MLWIEISATICGFLCVVLTIRRHIWCWPVGLAQVLLFIVIFYDAKLYSDLVLHVIYVFLQLYGWHNWETRGEESRDGSLVVATLSIRQLLGWVAITAAGSLSLGYSMQRWTDAAMPYGDAFTTVGSLVAQFLLARKQLENWLFWIVVDIAAVAIYWQKNLLPTTLLYTTFLVLASIGYLSWARRLREQASAAELAL